MGSVSLYACFLLDGDLDDERTGKYEAVLLFPFTDLYHGNKHALLP